MKPYVSRFLGLGLVAMALGACDGPGECVDGPSNVTPDAVASCFPPPEDVPLEEQIVSAGAETESDGTLVITLSSFGLQCGTRTSDLNIFEPSDCWRKGWALTVRIPPELAHAGSVIEMRDHPEVLGDVVAFSRLSAGGAGPSSEGEAFFTGTLELLAVNEACVTGIFTGFGTGRLDVILGGPELDGAFVAPRCGDIPPGSPSTSSPLSAAVPSRTLPPRSPHKQRSLLPRGT